MRVGAFQVLWHVYISHTARQRMVQSGLNLITFVDCPPGRCRKIEVLKSTTPQVSYNDNNPPPTENLQQPPKRGLSRTIKCVKCQIGDIELGTQKKPDESILGPTIPSLVYPAISLGYSGLGLH